MPRKQQSTEATIPSRSARAYAYEYFASLTFSNVACFGEYTQTISFLNQDGQLSNWTLIVGENGTGKTTVLKMLAGMKPSNRTFGFHDPASWSPYFLSWKDPSNNPIFLHRPGANALSIRVDYFSSDTPILGTSPQLPPYHGVAEQEIQSKPHGAYASKCHQGQMGGTLPPSCVAYGAGRLLGHAPSHSPFNRDDATANLFVEGGFLRSPEEWLLSLDYSIARSTAQSAQQDRLNRVKEALVGALPEDIDDLRFGSTEGYDPRPSVEFHTPFGWVPLQQLGQGYQSMFAWVVDLIRRMMERYPDSPNPLAEPAVVLIDEIDLHLHPKWQRDIIPFLSKRFPATQFIATAHSPLIVQAAASAGANLAVLRREGDHVVIENDVDRIRGWSVDQILTSELFGLETARPAEVEKEIAERREILAKPSLSTADKSRVRQLELQIGPLPTGETFDQAKRMMELLEESKRLAEKFGGTNK